MTQQYAKDLANRMSNQEIKEMLVNAMNGITDWTQPCKLNSGMSWGIAWNLLAKNFDGNNGHREFHKVQLLRMFEAWLPEKYKQVRKKKMNPEKVAHQEPDFTNWK
jgi:ATP-dependent phosphoenolpyruvate carboxykinase